MFKYDFNIDMSENNSVGKLLRKVKPQSVVLEFGCAAGRMTHYMKEILNCSVYIVEINCEAYDKARKYADGGVCDDIMAFSWVKEFKGLKFDNIIFADVLEHLADPKKVIEESLRLLNDNGEILVSIPNITHTDIILKAFQDRFDYTDIGILDNTHVHFWGLENIEEFAQDCGIYVHSIEATYAPAGTTEQYGKHMPAVSKTFMNSLSERKCGEVYQFIFTMGFYPAEDENIIKIADTTRTCTVYLDLGEGYSEKNKLIFKLDYIEDGVYSAHCVIKDVKGLKQIRFDPIEFQKCILYNLSVRQNGKSLKFGYCDHIGLNSGLLLMDTDPMVFIDVEPENGAVIIDADIIIASDRYIDLLESTCGDYQRKIQTNNQAMAEAENLKKKLVEQTALADDNINELNMRLEKLRLDYESLHKQSADEYNLLKAEKEQEYEKLKTTSEKKYDELKSEKEREYQKLKSISEREYNDLKIKKEQLEKDNLTLKNRIDIIDAALGKANSDLTAYIQLYCYKEKLLIEVEDKLLKHKKCLSEFRLKNEECERIVNEKNSLIAEMESIIQVRENTIAEMKSTITWYSGRRSIKLADKIRSILRKIKSIFIRKGG